MKSLTFLFLTLLWCFAAHATGLFNSIVNNISSGGHLCGSVKDQDYENFARQFSPTPRALQEKKREFTGLGRFENHLHHDSSLLYQKKTQCLSDFAHEVTSSRAAIQEIRQVSTLVWLNRRKAQLILRQCTLMQAEISKIMMSHTGTPVRYDARNYGIENLTRRNPEIDAAFFKDCQSKDTVAALRALVAFSERSLPFLSSRKLLDLIEGERALVISNKTQLPLSDRELLHLDLTASQGSLRIDRARVKKVEGLITGLIHTQTRERIDFSRSLKPQRFHQDTFQSLYDDGTVDELLQRVGIGQEELRTDKNLNRMLACTRAKYDTSLVGSTLDFITLFAITRSGLNQLRYFKALPRLAQEGLTATIASAAPLIKACTRQIPLPGRLSGSSMDVLGGPHKTHLSAGLDIDLFNLESVSIETIASCREHNYDHLFLEKSFASSCIEEALYATLPATLGLGMLATTMLGE